MKFFKAKKPKAQPAIVFTAVMIVVAGSLIAYSQKGPFTFPDFPSFQKDEVIQVTKNTGVTYVDPLDVFTALKKGGKEMVVVDIRDSKAYKQKYIRGSVNVPFDPAKADSFHSRVKAKAHGRQIVILPHSSFTTRGEQAIRALEKSGQQASLLKIGWNELYNLPNMWLPEEKWESFRFLDMIEHADGQ